MTIPEAARQLGLAEATLRLQVKLGKLRAVKRGRDYWLEPTEVARYAVENRKPR
jgi:excisionase family DNA binding protein